jgi:hypothetical protein
MMVSNGINGVTGDYLLPPLAIPDLAALARGETFDPRHLSELKYYHQRATEATFGLKEGVDAKNLAETGWGVIFSYDADPALREALAPLLDHRRRLAGAIKEQRYQEYREVRGYRPGESKLDFLARHGVGPSAVDPDKMPYYLLIVADPETIPFIFQYQLDVQYAVGRIWFDTLDEFACYARSVVQAETGGLSLARRAVYAGVQNHDDIATALSTTELIKPLVDCMSSDVPAWTHTAVVGEEVDKARLARLIGGEETPSLLFTAGHGMAFPKDDPRQLPHQGALLCSNWRGPKESRGPIPPEFYLAGEDVPADARLLGLIALNIACFGGGTPRLDGFARAPSNTRETLASRAFVAALPRRLLSHPRGGALAVAGHVDRLWGYSFTWPGAGRPFVTVSSALQPQMEGHPIGSAFEFFNQRYAELSSDLSVVLEDVRFGKTGDDVDLALAGMWTANNDARGYAILGDPAVRLMVGDGAVTPNEQRAVRIDTTVVPAAVAEPRPAPSGDGSATPPATASATTPAAIPVTEIPAAPDGGLPSAAALEYGLFDGGALKEARDRLGQTLRAFTESLGAMLGQAVSDLTHVTVSTYTSEQMDRVAYQDGGLAGPARLYAYTRVSLAGDTIACFPPNPGESNQALTDLHMQMVERAYANRVDLLKTAVSAATSLLDVLRVV